MDKDRSQYSQGGHPEFARKLAVSLAIAGLVTGAGPEKLAGPEEASASPGSEAVAAQVLEHKIEHNKPVTFDANTELLWSKAGQNFHTKEPALKVSFGDQTKFFGLKQRGEKLSTIDVYPLPGRAIEVQSKLTDKSRTGDAWHSTGINTSRGIVKLDRHGDPTVKVRYETGQTKRVGLGETGKLSEQGRSAFGGKRFADTSMERKLAKSSSVEQAEKSLQNFFRQYDLAVNVITPGTGPGIILETIKPADLSKLKKSGRVVIDAFAKYPADYIRNSGFKSINLVKNLSVAGDSRSAVYDTGHDAMFYSIDAIEHGEEFAEEAIHHENEHFVMENKTGSLTFSGSSWTSLNPANFEYKRGGDAWSEHPRAGFVSGYATFGEEEDPPEVQGYLMTTSKYHKLQEWVKTDPYLARKVQFMKNHNRSLSSGMSGNYYNQINPPAKRSIHF